MLFKMTLPIRKKTDDPDVSRLTLLTRKQKRSGIFFYTAERNRNGKNVGEDFETANTCVCMY